MKRSVRILLLLTVPTLLQAQAPQGQEAPVVTLGLEEALAQARNYNPEYRQQLNNLSTANTQVRSAYGSLLPGASVSAGMDYTGSGQTNFGQGFTRSTSAVVGSSYSAGFYWDIDGTRLLAPSIEKSNREAVSQEISSEEARLRFLISDQYLTAAAAGAEVTVAREQVLRNQTFLDLASARYRVGQGTLIEVRQAEVQKAQADVDLLRTVYLEKDAKLELFRRIGVAPPVPVEQIALSDSFPVTPVGVGLDQVLQEAEDFNPQLKALRARQQGAATNVKSARTEYLPSLSLRGGWSGFTQEQTDKDLLLSQSQAAALGGASSCLTQDSVRVGAGLAPIAPTPSTCYTALGLDPTTQQLTSQTQNAILDANNQFPFNFTNAPFGASLSISLPIFSGFSRQLRVQQAREFQQDADESVRAQQLLVRSGVTSRYLAWETAYEAIAVQAAGRDAARDQVRLAQDRYRLGTGTALEVSDAQIAVRRAEGDYIAAVYEYHRALAALEAAVGRPLSQ
ncbi:MAG: TolC family protein [Gemmatimonadota bacterium]|nr:TolC family protein [Gemmatimonadota bacterium]MDH4347702.1 TolC family protein [Gemmatimonadota bacterium]